MVRSFEELSKRKDELSALVREVFGAACVGTFGIGIGLVPIKRFKRKRRVPVESEATSDEHFGDLPSTGTVRDILIEAQRLPVGAVGRGMYLTNWEGFADLECSWVRESGMSKVTKDWWELERELRYPGYSSDDYPVYDDKHNSLCHSPATRDFLGSLPLELLGSATPEKSFSELVGKPEFKAWNFILALNGDISMELFFRITETLADGDRKVHIDEKLELLHDPPPPRPTRPLRLIVSSSSSEEDREVKTQEPTFTYRGQPAYLVREIRAERVVRGRHEYHVFWQGYDSTEATWEPAENVNREAVKKWRDKNI